MKVSFFSDVIDDLKAINPQKLSMLVNFFISNSFHIIFWYRVSHVLSKSRLKIFARIINGMVRIVYSCDISPFAVIGKRVVFMHGFDIVIGSNVLIGDDVKIFNGTTFGNRGGQHNDGQPRVDNNCVIGTGAKLLGNIHIEENSNIGANAVVLKNFPPNSTIVGIPAKQVTSL